MNRRKHTTITLTQWQVTIIDAELSLIINQFNWCAKWSPHTGTFYAVRNDYSGGKQKMIPMHRFIWETVNGPIPEGLRIDHINGDTLDNKLENLRVVTPRGNSHNRKDQREGRTSSKHVGVSWLKSSNKWRARVYAYEKDIHLGLFSSEEEAHEAYQKAYQAITAREGIQ